MHSLILINLATSVIYYLEIRQSKADISSHLIWLVFLCYLAKHQNTEIASFCTLDTRRAHTK